MDFRELKYKFEENKSKVMLIGGIIVFILAVIGMFKIFGIKFDYDSKFEGGESEKYVLATGIFGGNANGQVNLYNPTDGEILDKVQLEGDVFIYDKSSDMKTVNAYNPQTSELYEIKIKNKKLSVSKKGEIELNDNRVLNFDYDKNKFVALLENERSFIYRNLSTKKDMVIDLDLTSAVDSYLLVKNNLLFTSGDYIYTVNLSNGKHEKIDIGESSLSIHSLKNKVFIHNNFGFERNKSILLDIDPATLYINNVYQFKDSRVNIIETSSDSEKIYYSEEFLSSKEYNVNQVLKSMNEDMKSPVASIKHTSKYSISKLNSYGYLGYVYYHELDSLNIFNLKSLQNEYVLKVEDDFYMPMY